MSGLVGVWDVSVGVRERDSERESIFIIFLNNDPKIVELNLSSLSWQIFSPILNYKQSSGTKVGLWKLRYKTS